MPAVVPESSARTSVGNGGTAERSGSHHRPGTKEREIMTGKPTTTIGSGSDSGNSHIDIGNSGGRGSGKGREGGDSNFKNTIDNLDGSINWTRDPLCASASSSSFPESFLGLPSSRLSTSPDKIAKEVARAQLPDFRFPNTDQSQARIISGTLGTYSAKIDDVIDTDKRRRITTTKTTTSKTKTHWIPRPPASTPLICTATIPLPIGLNQQDFFTLSSNPTQVHTVAPNSAQTHTHTHKNPHNIHTHHTTPQDPFWTSFSPSPPPESMAYVATMPAHPIPLFTSQPTSSSPPPNLYETLRRMEAQNAAIRSAWEAERAYLEANRAHAVNIYLAERAIMDEQTTLMEQENSALLHEIHALKTRLQQVGKENEVLRMKVGMWSPEVPGSGAVTARPGLRRGASGVVGGLPGPRRPMDFLKREESGEEKGEKAAPVDIGEIHPELEGIPLKAAALKSPTFTDIGPGPSMPDGVLTSPLETSQSQRDQDHKSETEPELEGDIPDDARSEAMTEAGSEAVGLTARESFRLRIHAGHTPSHSISNLTALTDATGSTSGIETPGRSSTRDDDDAEPLMIATSRPLEDLPMPSAPSHTHIHNNSSTNSHPLRTAQTVSPPTEIHSVPIGIHNEDEQDMALLTPPGHDRPLTGPLMITNIPAKDEIFLNVLAAKLEEVKNSREASPESWKGEGSDMRWAISLPTGEVELGVEGEGEARAPVESQKPRVVPGAVGDDDEGGDEDDEDDIPLKFKKTTNFGLPMGMMGRIC